MPSPSATHVPLSFVYTQNTPTESLNAEHNKINLFFSLKKSTPKQDHRIQNPLSRRDTGVMVTPGPSGMF
jgi:hypothetical protein